MSLKQWIVAGFSCSLWLGSACVARCDVTVPAIFGDHMVLQRDRPTPVWGWASPGETVTVTLTGEDVHTQADDKGNWSVALPKRAASAEGQTLTIAGKNTIKLNDVLVGEVWLCSGQSNMELRLDHASNASTAIPAADRPTMRLFLVGHTLSPSPVNDVKGKWVLCTPEAAASFSAVGYFFGTEILADQKVPVGLIGSHWGGTRAQCWTSESALLANPATASLGETAKQNREHPDDLKKEYATIALPAYEKAHAAWAARQGDPTTRAAARKRLAKDAEPRIPKPTWESPLEPSCLFNGMIAPIARYGLRGVVWYQGESNIGEAMLYRTLFPLMITNWRARWGQGDFPFIWTQLPNYIRPGDPIDGDSNRWSGIRDAQTLTLHLPQTGQAVTIDLGETKNLHPTDKADVGHRLALVAQHLVYGENVADSGPTLKSMQIAGGVARLTFDHVNAGFVIAKRKSNDAGAPVLPVDEPIAEFRIAGDDKKFFPAEAKIDGAAMAVSSPKVPHPVAVRYAWEQAPTVNLYNKDGLPAAPFRTDDWVTGMPGAATQSAEGK